jgi:preprotein translocase subunit SecY
MFPVTVTNFIRHPWAEVVKNIFSPTGFIYNVLYIILIIFFCYFYTAIIFNPVDVAENMKKYGGFIPGIRPGKPTAEYIDRVLSRITLVGGLYLSLVCVLPSILIGKFHVPFYLGGTALLIVVGVALDTLQQIEAHLLTRQYETLIKGIRIRGRR